MYAGYLLSVIRRYCTHTGRAQDVLQETWISIFRNIQNYEEQGLFKAWISKIAITQCYKELRKNKQISYVDQTPDQLLVLPNVDSDLDYEDLMKIVNKLKSPHRNIFLMNVIDGLSHKEIGKLMNIAESTSRAHLTNARKKLRDMISVSSITL